LLSIEADTVGYSNEHIAVGDAVMLGHAYPDAVAVRVDHGLEVTVYSAPLGPMMRPLRSPTSSVLPLWLLTRIGGVSAAMAGAVRPMVRATDNSVAVMCHNTL